MRTTTSEDLPTSYRYLAKCFTLKKTAQIVSKNIISQKAAVMLIRESDHRFVYTFCLNGKNGFYLVMRTKKTFDLCLATFKAHFIRFSTIKMFYPL